MSVMKLYHGDFNIITKSFEDNSIDAIVTDPMYYPAMLHTWDELGALAKRVLKPSGFCVAYSGYLYLPQVFERMEKHKPDLQYYVVMCLIMNGTIETIKPINMQQRWKPVIIYQKSPRKTVSRLVEDTVRKDTREKSDYKFQQGVQGVCELLEIFTKEGDTVLDPMMGSGTTCIACDKIKRNSIGIEIEPQSEHSEKVFDEAVKRIRNLGINPTIFEQPKKELTAEEIKEKEKFAEFCKSLLKEVK